MLGVLDGITERIDNPGAGAVAIATMLDRIGGKPEVAPPHAEAAGKPPLRETIKGRDAMPKAEGR